jgi:phage-related protein
VEPRRDSGFQLDRVQRGLDPDDWKPIKIVGQGVREIRVRDASGAFRVIYVGAFAEAIYVLTPSRRRRSERRRAISRLQNRGFGN